MSNPKSKSLPSIFSMFFIMLVVYCLDIFLFESDLAFWGEAFYSSVLSIAVLFLYVQASKSKLSVLGISKLQQKITGGLLFGACFSVVPMLLVLVGEFILLGTFKLKFLPPSLANLDPEMNMPPVLAVVIYIFTAFLAVLLEELFFRGLMLKKLKKVTSFAKANMIQSLLYATFGFLAVLRNLIKGYCDDFASALAVVALCILCEVLSSIKWGLLTRISGAVYVSITDHFLFSFFANSIFVADEYGLLALMLRMAMIQLLSFIAVLGCYKLVMKKIMQKKAEQKKIKEANRKKREEKRQQDEKVIEVKADGMDYISPSGFKKLSGDERMKSEILKEKAILNSSPELNEKLSEAEIDRFLRDLSGKIFAHRRKNKKDSTEITEDFDTDVFLRHYQDGEKTHHHSHHTHHRSHAEEYSHSKEKSEKKSQSEQKPKKTLMRVLASWGAVDDSSSNDLI